VSYQVFARKYRPKTFADLLGQDHVVRTLRNAIEQGRLAHAYLFVGPRGTGKTSTARIFAKALNCSGGPKIDFDPDEDICREIAEGISLDVLEIDGASNNGVEHVRELRETVKFAPARCRFKIYYIDEVHMLSTAAFNALLKTLEEPPAHVKFIFATTEAHKVLPTIVSRCQRFDLRRIPVKVIAGHLLHIAGLEGVDLEEKAAYAIAKAADGGMRDAQSMLDQLVAFCGHRIEEANVLEVFGFTSMERIADMVDALLARRTAEALDIIHEESGRGRDLALFLGELITYLRNLIVAVIDPRTEFSDLSPEAANRLKEQTQRTTPERMLRLIDHFATSETKLRWAPNKGLHLEIAIIKALQILGETTISDVISLLHQAGAESGAAPSAPPKAKPEGRRDDSTPSRPATATIAPASSPVPPETPEPEPRARPARPVGPLQGVALWDGVVQVIAAEKPLSTSWARAGVFAEQNPKRLVVHFAPSDQFARDSLMREGIKTFIEDTLRDLSGGLSLAFAAEIRDDVVPPPPPELPEDEPEDTPPPAREAKSASSPAKTTPESKKKPSPKAPPEETPPASPPDSSSGPPRAADPVDPESYLNDPLIQGALELFEAELES
jgi:DNA polymerase-3 subunit gamma/tau